MQLRPTVLRPHPHQRVNLRLLLYTAMLTIWKCLIRNNIQLCVKISTKVTIITYKLNIINIDGNSDFKTEAATIDLHLLSDNSNISDNSQGDIDSEMKDESPVSSTP